MTSQYRSLDRSTRSAIFFASLLVAISLLTSVTTAFGPIVTHIQSDNGVEEVVVQG
jgi:hypothetical protein